MRLTNIHEPGKRPRTMFQSDRDTEVACEREMCRREKLAEHDVRRQQSASNPDHSMAVNIKGCLLEVQKVYLNRLAAEDNNVTGVAEIPGAHAIDFEKNRREAESVVERLWSSERSLNYHVNIVNNIWITDTKLDKVRNNNRAVRRIIAVWSFAWKCVCTELQTWFKYDQVDQNA